MNSLKKLLTIYSNDILKEKCNDWLKITKTKL